MKVESSLRKQSNCTTMIIKESTRLEVMLKNKLPVNNNASAKSMYFLTVSLIIKLFTNLPN